MYLADTNVFIRFLTKDDPKKAEEVFKVITKARSGSLKLYTLESVIVEVVQILKSKVLYNLSKIEIKQKLYPIILIENLIIENKNIYLLALDLYVQYNIDFTDAILAAKYYTTEFDAIYSFDRDFDKLEKIVRVEII